MSSNILSIAAPVITGYSDGVFTGTEATADTIVMVYTTSTGQAVSQKWAIVVDGQWSLTADLPPVVGSNCYAIATLLTAGSLSPTSQPSNPYPVGS